MSRIKATLAIGVILLFLGAAMIPASAYIRDSRKTALFERSAVYNFINEILLLNIEI